mmetsp:Transcript_1090/g.2613  ORF Transcript_1090/g.2613 Transcript_1090/m.2613 type:complete len:202 (-) Transcript_1090:229-834(-)
MCQAEDPVVMVARHCDENLGLGLQGDAAVDVRGDVARSVVEVVAQDPPIVRAGIRHKGVEQLDSPFGRLVLVAVPAPDPANDAASAHAGIRDEHARRAGALRRDPHVYLGTDIELDLLARRGRLHGRVQVLARPRVPEGSGVVKEALDWRVIGTRDHRDPDLVVRLCPEALGDADIGPHCLMVGGARRWRGWAERLTAAGG